uniref:UTP23 sensor motif region domain-containing protein n=1 Tax=Trypanosoma vivax (strain Y486) TaxID=1055687 RepID=G0TRE7_TRYVY|nr:conserved hypothetical protein [Trypanosoma vivax Y486]
MKRRVLRAHANKRCLRLISAEHGLLLDTYNVLCDASFLRAFCISFGTSGASNKVGGNGTGADGKNRMVPSRALQALMYETFAAATSHAAHADVDPSACKKPKGIALTLCYLPETATTLRRLVQQQGQQGGGKASRGKRKGKNTCSSAVADSLLSGLECIAYGRDANAPEMRNEGKAIAKFIADVSRGVGDEVYSLMGRKNAHCFFVATQSHDVRRLLPESTALMRLTTSPVALWIERNGNTFCYNDAHGGSNDACVGGTRTTSRENRNAGLAAKGKSLSAADLAFMHHLSPHLVPGASTSKRRRLEAVGKPSHSDANSSECGGGGTAPGGNTVVAAVRAVKRGGGIFARKKAKGPNPLSVKKKRVRECVRVCSDSAGRKRT